MNQRPSDSKNGLERVPCIRCFNEGAVIHWGVNPPHDYTDCFQVPAGLKWNKCVCPNPECGASYFASNDRTYLVIFQKTPGLKQEGYGLPSRSPIHVRWRGRKLPSAHRMVR